MIGIHARPVPFSPSISLTTVADRDPWFLSSHASAHPRLQLITQPQPGLRTHLNDMTSTLQTHQVQMYPWVYA
ncbi:hypothetical protein BDQ94DRAFT_141064 [Aspergillus welwitschiae]|uniref:Uncharacterized protein n=1 Tax=Aspergillus welwitschiae TaxID=1341132 RepID=A0A3F3Q7T9_9EURO|nr:hypothetical protein BDQ94DRAFT_141064 [Aspergillus welwitschiae]RDH34882.1 hypothetical protein BDQ94DRAFT_141064 [Aspergillus welwitschiae]